MLLKLKSPEGTGLETGWVTSCEQYMYQLVSFLCCFILLLFSLSYLMTTCVLENVFSNIYFILTIKKSLMYVCWKKNVAQLSRGYYLRPIKFIAQNAHGGRTKTKQDFSSANDFAFFPFLRKILSKQCHR